MSNLIFRSAQGANDAPKLIAVHDACREIDNFLVDSVLEYKATIDWYKDELQKTDTADWVIAQIGDEVVGYGHTLWDWSEQDGNHCYLHQGWVKSRWRGQGIGRQLLQQLENRCYEKATRDGTTAQAEMGANATGTEESAQRLLKREGYYPLYTLVEMDFLLSQSLPDSSMPLGYELRPALPDHYRAIWQCIGDAYFIPNEENRGREISPESDYERYFSSESADPTLWFIAWEKSRIAGQCLCRIENGVGEVFEVSVGHPHRRKGLAKTLLTLALRELQQRNVNCIRLFTKLENPTKAWALYESVGFKTIKTFPRWRKPLKI
jgi:mycothiol synthase